jgi:hypothetical protein
MIDGRRSTNHERRSHERHTFSGPASLRKGFEIGRGHGAADVLAGRHGVPILSGSQPDLASVARDCRCENSRNQRTHRTEPLAILHGILACDAAADR